MKILLPILIVTIFLLTGCAAVSSADNKENTAEDKGTTQLVNPVTEFEDAKALFKDTGVSLTLPEGAAVVSFSSIAQETGSKIAQAVFTLDGDEYCYRGKKTEDSGEDITGMYYPWAQPEHLPEDARCEIYTKDDEAGVCLWYIKDTRYSVSMTENATGEKLEAIYRMLAGD